MLKQKECGNNLRAEDGLKKTPSVCSVFNFTTRTWTCNEQGVCLTAFKHLGYFTNVCRLWILATLWGKVHLYEHRSSPFSTVITTSQNNRTHLFTYQVARGRCSSTSRWNQRRDVRWTSATDQTQESWKCGKDDQSNIWQLQPGRNVCRIN
jgi:hypothetical protein